MDDWRTLRKLDYDADKAWTCYQAWVKPKSKTSKTRLRVLEGDFLKSVIPLVGCVMRNNFRRLQSADRDDICSEISLRILRKSQKYSAKFLATGNPDSFTALMRVTLKNLICDNLRGKMHEMDRLKSIPGELLHRRPQVTVSKSVELNTILRELPQQITLFALERDRFGFGVRPIRVVARLLISGKDVSEDMLRNWLGVEDPERCISFVVLMSRWYLHKCRKRYAPVLDGELSEQVMTLDQNCHIL